MSLFDDNLSDVLDKNIYERYFDDTNILICACNFENLIRNTLKRCHKRTKSTFVYIKKKYDQVYFEFIHNGYLIYEVSYTNHILKKDWTQYTKKCKFAAYYKAYCGRKSEYIDEIFFDLNENEMNNFYNIIFNVDF